MLSRPEETVDRVVVAAQDAADADAVLGHLMRAALPANATQDVDAAAVRLTCT